ncbi:MAG: hypothetical protein LBQ08_00900 [Holosporaceae bacterium]|nr:hypothetical protein [Holosporaceae bacterium]
MGLLSNVSTKAGLSQKLISGSLERWKRHIDTWSNNALKCLLERNPKFAGAIAQKRENDARKVNLRAGGPASRKISAP